MDGRIDQGSIIDYEFNGKSVFLSAKLIRIHINFIVESHAAILHRLGTISDIPIEDVARPDRSAALCPVGASAVPASRIEDSLLFARAAQTFHSAQISIVGTGLAVHLVRPRGAPVVQTLKVAVDADAFAIDGVVLPQVLDVAAGAEGVADAGHAAGNGLAAGGALAALVLAVLAGDRVQNPGGPILVLGAYGESESESVA